MGTKRYPNQSAAQILGTKKYPLRFLGTKNLKIEYSSSEIPDVEIYSGLYFSIINKKLIKIISGGCFNTLSSSLGLRPINAVGAAINLS